MTRRRGTPFILAIAAAVCLQAAAQAQPQPAPAFVRSITQVRDDLFKVQSGPGIGAVTVFLVTREGIVLADPLNQEFSSWLKGELAARFPERPVRYVLETHYHWDHARGGAVFADTAKFIAHQNMLKNMDARIRDARPPGDTDDLDGDDRLTREEALTGTRAQFDRLDGNADGFLTQPEMMSEVRRPDITFADRHTLELGDGRVELVHAGNRHSSDLFDVYFPDQKVLFAQDYLWAKRVCCGFSFDRRPIRTVMDSIRTLEALDFDVVIHSHWEPGTKADLANLRIFLEELERQVSAGIAAGKTLDAIKTDVRLEQYRSWAGYDQQLPQIIESAYNSLTRY